MLRCALPVVFAIAMTGATLGADNMVPPHVRHPPRAQLPAGLPRAHYNNRTTITYGAPRSREVDVEGGPDLLFTPTVPYVPVVPLMIERPLLLPGSSTLPGYYGSSHSYDYQGPYYGGTGNLRYWDRLPYACGVYGYC